MCSRKWGPTAGVECSIGISRPSSMIKMQFTSDVSLLMFYPLTLLIAEDRTLRPAAIELSVLLVFNLCVLRLIC